MSNFTPLDEQYPNQFLGVSAVTDTNTGTGNKVEAPVKFATAAGVGGFILQSGSGAPAVGGNVGDLFVRTDGDPTMSTYLYACTTAGTAGNAVWTALKTA